MTDRRCVRILALRLEYFQNGPEVEVQILDLVERCDELGELSEVIIIGLHLNTVNKIL